MKLITKKNRYLSILKHKAGEVDAIQHLNTNIWEKWNPLFELMYPDPTKKENSPVKYAAKIVGDMKKSCRAGATVFVDFKKFQANLSASFINEMLMQILAENVIPIPVVHIDTSTKVLEGINQFLSQNKITSNFAFRLTPSQIQPQLESKIQAVLISIQQPVDNGFLVFDMGEIHDLRSQLEVVIPELIQRIPYLKDWISVTIAGTSIPKVLAMSSDSNALLLRDEWILFVKTHKQMMRFVKRLDYGDYTISNPVLIDFDPRKMQVCPKIFYTINEKFLVYKGKSTKIHGWGQTSTMCASLSKRSEFLGATFSHGDECIDNCAKKKIHSNGNGRTWKKAGTNHHITFVAQQVSSLFLS
jgi:hypothetical protein